MKPLQLTREEFDALPEYSASLPTGTTPGKMWRRYNGAHDREFIAGGGKPTWIIGQYDPLDDGKEPTIAIDWYTPVFVVPGSKMRSELSRLVAPV